VFYFEFNFTNLNDIYFYFWCMENAINYRKIEEKDNVKVAKLIRDALIEHELNQPGTVYFDPTTDALFELFQIANSCYFIAENSSKILGACGIFPTEGLPENHIELVKFYVHADFRGKSIGKKLMELSLDEAKKSGFKKVYLESLPELKKAVGMYERFGFKHIPKRLGNSGHFACNILMLKELD
jgi:putative acetyltransferase